MYIAQPRLGNDINFRAKQIERRIFDKNTSINLKVPYILVTMYAMPWHGKSYFANETKGLHGAIKS